MKIKFKIFKTIKEVKKLEVYIINEFRKNKQIY